MQKEHVYCYGLLITHNTEDHCAEGACSGRKSSLAYSGKSVTILDVIRTFDEYLVLNVAQSIQVGIFLTSVKEKHC